ncbi:hypothetical protein RDI58_015431 [Solanum bulbocastanum]|uniref:Acyl carrier protein n=1 Tax=Solanum bulbocastanum TaxID=147425 RepID=A0AAN8TNA9_SOLBU
MASITGSSATAMNCSFKALNRVSNLKTSSLSFKGISYSSIRVNPATRRLRITCAAKPETVNKVCDIVKKQLALSADTEVSGDSKFAALGADSLDTVCSLALRQFVAMHCSLFRKNGGDCHGT